MPRTWYLLLCLMMTSPVLGQGYSSDQIGRFASAYSKSYNQLLRGESTGLMVFGDAVPQTGILIVRRGENIADTLCSATAISPKHVISAAHCVCTTKTKTAATCQPNLAQISATFLSPSQGVFQIAQGKIAVSPQYASVTLEGRAKDAPVADLAIFELDEPISNYVELGTFVNNLNYLTQQGYGTLGATDNEATPRKFPKPNKWYQFGVPQTVGYPQVSSSCGPKVPSDRLCYDVSKIPTDDPRLADATLCDGDSGSGLFSWHDGRPVLVAVASSISDTRKCQNIESFDQTTFYVSIASHRAWIGTMLSQDLPASPYDQATCHDLILPGSFTVANAEADTLSVIPFSEIPEQAHEQRRPKPDLEVRGGASCELVEGGTPEFRAWFCQLKQETAQVVISAGANELQAIRLCQGETK